MTDKDKISIRAFAKSIKVSEGAVRKAIREGKFEYGYDVSSKKINPAAAKKNTWVAQQSIVKAKAGVSKQKAINKLNNKNTSSADENNDAGDGNDNTDVELDAEELLNSIHITSNMSVDKVVRLRELVALALDKKKLEEAERVLVPRDKVEKALYAVGNELKKSLLNLPQKVVRQIMDCATEVDGINILSDSITEILTVYGNLKSTSLN